MELKIQHNKIIGSSHISNQKYMHAKNTVKSKHIQKLKKSNIVHGLQFLETGFLFHR